MAVAGYAAVVGLAWLRYGKVSGLSAREGPDALLDQFLPDYEVVERHEVAVDAPAETVYAASREMDLFGSPLARGIFKAREALLGTKPRETALPRGLVEQAKAMGWGVLAETPNRELVMGAVTQPWEANVVFRALPAAEFRAFQDPDFVKIVWTLRADPAEATSSVFRTETRARACGPAARRKFRKYWAFLSPGIALIRLAMLGPLRREAEQRYRQESGR